MCDGAHAKHNAATGDNVVRCSWHKGGLRSTQLQLIAGSAARWLRRHAAGATMVASLS